jgi:hypothetical protein
MIQRGSRKLWVINGKWLEKRGAIFFGYGVKNGFGA